MIEPSCPRCGYLPEFCKCLDADTVAAERDAERKAWARLVKAAAADMDSLSTCATEPTEENIDAHSEKNAEYWAARKALCDLGVDVDGLLRKP